MNTHLLGPVGTRIAEIRNRELSAGVTAQKPHSIKAETEAWSEPPASAASCVEGRKCVGGHELVKIVALDTYTLSRKEKEAWAPPSFPRRMLPFDENYRQKFAGLWDLVDADINQGHDSSLDDQNQDAATGSRPEFQDRGSRTATKSSFHGRPLLTLKLRFGGTDKPAGVDAGLFCAAYEESRIPAMDRLESWFKNLSQADAKRFWRDYGSLELTENCRLHFGSLLALREDSVLAWHPPRDAHVRY